MVNGKTYQLEIRKSSFAQDLIILDMPESGSYEWSNTFCHTGSLAERFTMENPEGTVQEHFVQYSHDGFVLHQVYENGLTKAYYFLDQSGTRKDIQNIDEFREMAHSFHSKQFYEILVHDFGKALLKNTPEDPKDISRILQIIKALPGNSPYFFELLVNNFYRNENRDKSFRHPNDIISEENGDFGSQIMMRALWAYINGYIPKIYYLETMNSQGKTKGETYDMIFFDPASKKTFRLNPEWSLSSIPANDVEQYVKKDNDSEPFRKGGFSTVITYKLDVIPHNATLNSDIEDSKHL